jgi:cytochrome c oxidase subunit II
VAGLAGGKVVLDDGSTVTADDTYLAKAITDPDAQIVKGYTKGVMSGAISSFGLSGKPQDVDALVAFIKAQRPP